jgi:hypothetical protein
MRVPHLQLQVTNVMTASLQPIEEEVVLLKAITELIDSMVNLEMFFVNGSDPNTDILFGTPTHQRFFNIMLVDFLSRTDKKGPVQQTTYLSALQHIADSPSFNDNNSIRPLREATRRFAEWLEQEVEVDVWFASIIEFRKSNVNGHYPNGDGSLDARMSDRSWFWERHTRRLLA